MLGVAVEVRISALGRVEDRPEPVGENHSSCDDCGECSYEDFHRFMVLWGADADAAGQSSIAGRDVAGC